jgi:hypothetical protein
MKTQSITTYSFNELSEESKKKVLSKYIETAISDYWYEDTYFSAKEQGVEITGFDLDRGQRIDGEFIWEHIEVADNMLNDITKGHPLYTISEQFRKERDEICENWEKDENDEPINTDELDEKLDELEGQYEKDILWEYWKILRNEYEYLYSNEYLCEYFEDNDYQFTENGIIYNF